MARIGWLLMLAALHARHPTEITRVIHFTRTGFASWWVWALILGALLLAAVMLLSWDGPPSRRP